MSQDNSVVIYVDVYGCILTPLSLKKTLFSKEKALNTENKPVY